MLVINFSGIVVYDWLQSAKADILWIWLRCI